MRLVRSCPGRAGRGEFTSPVDGLGRDGRPPAHPMQGATADGDMGTEEVVSRHEDLWQVMIGPAGCLMTSEELKAALARDDVHRSTLVRRPGNVRWTSAREALELARTEQDRSIDAELPNLPPPIDPMRPRKKSESGRERDRRTWRPTLGTIFGLGILAFVSGAVSTASLTRSFDNKPAPTAATPPPPPAVPASAPTPSAEPAPPQTVAQVVVSADAPDAAANAPKMRPPKTPASAIASAAPAPDAKVASKTAAREALLQPPPPLPAKEAKQGAPHAPPPAIVPAVGRAHAPTKAAPVAAKARPQPHHAAAKPKPWQKQATWKSSPASHSKAKKKHR
jgi:hypothetical protein